MKITAFQTELSGIQPFRALFLQENNFQIRYNACHERNWSDSYLLTVEGAIVGYGSIKGKEHLSARDAVFEFFVIQPFRKMASLLFSELLTTSEATFIECQSNDWLLTSMLYEFAQHIYADVFLFEDHIATNYSYPGVRFRQRRENDVIFDHEMEPVGDYVLELDGAVVATGGFMLYYNMPFADLYGEVRADCRNKGLGTFMLQELKKTCYLQGRVPAARCNLRNEASKAHLLKAGLKVTGFMLTGEVQHRVLNDKQ